MPVPSVPTEQSMKDEFHASQALVIFLSLIGTYIYFYNLLLMCRELKSSNIDKLALARHCPDF